MKDAALGAKASSSAGPIDQAVVPPTGLPSASVHRKAAPPQACTSMPRCCLYQACIAFGSLALKKMPPIPVTRFMCANLARAIRRERAVDAREERVFADRRGDAGAVELSLDAVGDAGEDEPDVLLLQLRVRLEQRLAAGVVDVSDAH